jgi:hypothetical protein
VIESAKRHGKRAAIGNAAQAAEWLIGFNVMFYSLDLVVYRDALRAAVDELRRGTRAPD